MKTEDYIEIITSEQAEEGDICQKFGFRDEMGGLGYHRIREIQAVRDIAGAVIAAVAHDRYESAIAGTLANRQLTNSMLSLELAAALLARLGGDCGRAAIELPQAVRRAFMVIDEMPETIMPGSGETVRAALRGKL